MLDGDLRMSQAEESEDRSGQRMATALSARVRFELPSGPVEVECTIRDISSTGARVLCRQPLPMEELVQLYIQGPTRDIRAKAEVLSSDRLEGFGSYEAEVRFTEFHLKKPR